jgi:hypothetical protein
MRVILSNEDAERLAQLIEASPDAQLRMETRDKKVGEGGTVWVVFEGMEFAGKARRTPGRTGSFKIEDLDGRIIFEGP